MVALFAFAATLLVAACLSEIERGMFEGIADAYTIFCSMGLVVVASIMSYFSIDVLVSRWLYGQPPEGTRA
jgi:hypothetical protein